MLSNQLRPLAWHEAAKLVSEKGISSAELVFERQLNGDVNVSTLALWRPKKKAYITLFTCSAPNNAIANAENLSEFQKYKPVSVKQDAEMSRWMELSVKHFVGMEKRISVVVVKTCGSISEGEYVAIAETRKLDDPTYLYFTWISASNQVLRVKRLYSRHPGRGENK